MTKLCFIDTNVLVYARDPREPKKRLEAQTWLGGLADSGAIVISPQVVNEFCHVVRRKLKHVSSDALRGFVREMGEFCTAPSTFETSEFGLLLHIETGFAIFDSVLLASALVSGCEYFLSEDLQDDREVRGIRIVNPFVRTLANFMSKL